MKKWYQSKTVIFNVLTLVAGLLVVCTDQSWIMDMDVAPYLLSAVAIVNVALRMVTNKEIK